ncbi:MAG: hypothetical protein FJ279_31720 [Planctomycetes bacterium]|nr:hypothetical protein [Planctomycetota bacterium]
MPGKISRGWGILKQSWLALGRDKKLLLLPVLSGMACLLILASFVLPLALAPDTWEFLQDEKLQAREVWKQPVTYVLTFGFYLSTYFVVVFFNTALVWCAVNRFNGGSPTIAAGLRVALSRFPQILGWALVAASVGTLLKAVEDRLSWLGQWVVRLIGVAWSIVTYFVVPVLAVEGLGPLAAVRRSASLLRKSWGESLVGEVSMGAISMVLALPAICVALAGLVAGIVAASLWWVAIAMAPAVLYLVALAVVTSALQQVFMAGVYLYAAEGRVPSGFSEDSLRSAFRAKTA